MTAYPSRDINSKWTQLRARWDGENFIEEEEISLPDRILRMEIIQKTNWEGVPKLVLRFIGGPTGFESYYTEDLRDLRDQNWSHFCICGGTVNSWPKCTVDPTEVANFLDEVLRNVKL